jgi:hypothetical protein
MLLVRALRIWHGRSQVRFAAGSVHSAQPPAVFSVLLSPRTLQLGKRRMRSRGRLGAVGP